jgi:hypothetical protein
MKCILWFLTGTLIVVLATACNAPLAPAPTTEPAPATSTQAPATATSEPTTVATDQAPSGRPAGGLLTYPMTLAQAFTDKNIDQLRGMMGDSFSMAGWRGDDRTLTPEQAEDELRSIYLVDGSNPAVDMNADLRALLDGTDPFSILPPGLVGESAFLVKGLGASASDEAIIYIAHGATGPQSFAAMLVALGGFHPQAGSLDDLNTIGENLAQAVQSRDSVAMRALMQPRFSIAIFDTSLYEYTSEEALAQLQQSVFAEGAQPVVQFADDVPALLSGRDPLGEWGPVAQPVRAVHVNGLGADGQGEAVLVIANNPETGQLYWHGILLPKDGKKFQ